MKAWLFTTALAMVVFVVAGTAIGAANGKFSDAPVEEAGYQAVTPDGKPLGPKIKVGKEGHRPSTVDLSVAVKKGDPTETKDRSTANLVLQDAVMRKVQAWNDPRSLSAYTCYNVWATRIVRSGVVNATVAKLKSNVRFCGNLGSISPTPTHWVEPTVVDLIWRNGGPAGQTANWYTYTAGKPASGFYVYKRHHFYNGLPKLPLLSQNAYPWVQIWVHGNGTWAWNTGQG